MIFGLFLVASAWASQCSFSTTMSVASEISSLASCSTLEGDIVITGTDYSELDWSKVESIGANVLIEDSSNVTTVNLSNLKEIGGSLELNMLTSVQLLDMSLLTSANELYIISLTNLDSLTMNSSCVVTSFTLSNTKVTSVDSLMDYTTVGTLNINNNAEITLIELLDLETVDLWLVLAANSPDADISLPKLTTAANLELQDVSLALIPKLENISETLVLTNNNWEAFTLEKLYSVGVAIQVLKNDAMKSFLLPDLSYINGSLEITNNTELNNIDLDNLETISGATTISGDFYNFTLPSLTAADGLFIIASTNENFTCDYFDDLYLNGEIKASGYTCNALYVSSSSGSSGSSKKSSDGNFLSVNWFLSFLSVAAIYTWTF